MSDDKRKPDANATIQIDLDALDQVLANNPPGSERSVGSSAATGSRDRSLPPPLPPEHRGSQAGAPPSHTLPSVTVPPPRSAGKTFLFIGLFVVLLVVAIVGGLRVGGFGRTDSAPLPSASITKPTASPVASAAPSVAAPAAAPSENLLVIPPTEIVSP